MDDAYLYQKIAAEIRREILDGKFKAGDRLPTIRQMTERWDCTIGTAQRAYQELAREGLVISRAGQGTHVVKAPLPVEDIALRRAGLVHRSESFLLEMLTAGYTPVEIQAAIHQAMERWQVIVQQQTLPEGRTLRFAGSHDPALAWLAAHFAEIMPGFNLQLSFTGSLGGLMALAGGEAHLAGCHLWDEQSGTYNEPFVRRILPGKRVAVLTLAHRRLGLITGCGNPLAIQSLADLTRPGLRFVNSQTGSGTRVWIDGNLRKTGILPAQIRGYDCERMTHFEVAALVAEGGADVGFGLETAAQSYGLDFIHLVRERYDLVIPQGNIDTSSIERLAEWLRTGEVRQSISNLGGYDIEETGSLHWLN